MSLIIPPTSMALTPGTQLGTYEIVGLLGAGGMGEVYRARDSRLKRDVAIKVLPEAFSNDHERISRLLREAEVLASLNHFHIAAIYDVAQHASTRFLVLELVEGETLAERISRGPIPINETLRIARQLAEAIESAHEKGIIHRDLKPANIKITNEGNVKVLDFGLAKVRAVESTDGSNAPTLLSASAPGVILGTPAYLSPEQANGKDADRTSDIWAFGCLLFEMLSGSRVFQGDTVGEILAAVLKVEPDWRRLPQDTPAGIRRLIRRCLEKNPKNRLQHIGDARIEIDDALEDAGKRAPSPVRNRTRLKERVAWVSVLIVAVAIVWTTRRPVPAGDGSTFDIVTPPTADDTSLAISPDGKKICFEATSSGRSQLWLRFFDSGVQQALPGTDNARRPFWSADGRSIGFFADSKLKRINVDGSELQTVATASDGVGGSWNLNGDILFVPVPGAPVFRVPAIGGTPIAATRIDRKQDGHVYPHFFPDGRHFLYLATGESTGIYLGQLDSPESRRLIDADTTTMYARGYVFFGHQGKMFAQAFDLDQLALRGPRIALGLAVQQQYGATIAVSDGGVIVYRPQRIRLRQFLWVDRSGNKLEEATQAGPGVFSAEISPNGLRVVADGPRADGNYDVWILDTARNAFSPITDSPAVDAFPIWSPDNNEIVYWSNKDQPADKNLTGAMYRRSAAGGGKEEMLFPDGPPLDWYGNFVLYRSQVAGMGWDIFAVSLMSDRKPIPVVQTKDDERDAQFYPLTGKWIAYQSNRSGQWEIYVQPFPAGNFIPVSINGGAQPRWSRDGKELFYIALDGKLMAVPIRVSGDGQTLEPGTPAPLFQTHMGGALQSIFRQAYMVSKDRQRFLMNTVVEELNNSPIKIILNWKPPNSGS